MGRVTKNLGEQKKVTLISKKSKFKARCSNVKNVVKQPAAVLTEEREEIIQDLPAEFNEENMPFVSENVNEDVKIDEKCSDIEMTKFIESAIRTNCIKFDVKRSATTHLLSELNKRFPLLCKDFRTLLKSPRTTKTRNIINGTCVHFDMKEHLYKAIDIMDYTDETYFIDVFIDGVNFYTDSRNKTFWVVICRINDTMIPVEVFNGKHAPGDFNEFLKDFVVDLKKLLTDHERFKIRNFILDSPAKSKVKCVKMPNGYNACNECNIEGFYDSHRVVYDEFNCTLRTDESFRARNDDNHHEGISILEAELPALNMIYNFPPDYLHVVLLNILKKMLKFLFIPPHSILPIAAQKELSEKLETYNSYLPKEMHRKFRNMSDLSNMHGHELRVFLLKIGILVLKNTVPAEFYKNFIKFHVGISILCDPKLCILLNEIAGEILNEFCDEAISLYGNRIGTLMLHSISHLSQAVKYQNVSLDSFSTFPFECYLMKLKNLIHSSNKPLSQLHRRIQEIFLAYVYEKRCDTSETKFIKLISANFFSKVIWKGWTFCIHGHNDRFLLTNSNELCEIQKIEKDGNCPIFFCKTLKIIGDFYQFPIKSSLLSIYKVKFEYMISKTISIENLKYKMMVLPIDEMSSLAVPIKNIYTK